MSADLYYFTICQSKLSTGIKNISLKKKPRLGDPIKFKTCNKTKLFIHLPKLGDPIKVSTGNLDSGI